jgi:hypothetical protein
MLKTLSLAAAVMAAVVSISATSACAQDIYVVEGGRTTVTLTKGFIDTLANANIVATTAYGSQLFNGKVDFPITSGAVSLKTIAGQLLHSGGINLTLGSKVVRLDSLVFNTLSDKPFVTGLVIVDGKFVGRIKLFNVELPSDLTFPIVPKDGDFFLSDVKLTLDEEAATALNTAFSVKTFTTGADFGYSLSLVLLPLAADGE